jgi:hypothetical protein
MDDHYRQRPLAGWFMPAAIASLLFMLLGCALYAIHVTTDPASLPLDQRALFEAEPGWVSAAMGAASAIGAIGCVLLIARRKAAEMLLLLSLALVGIWFVGLFAVPQLRDLLGTIQIAAAIAVTALTWTIYWFARHSRQRGWLR